MNSYSSDQDTNITHKKEKFISIFTSYDPTREKKDISCVYCSRFLYKETGNIDAIVDTKYDNGFMSKEIICRSCKTRYIINQKIPAQDIYEQLV